MHGIAEADIRCADTLYDPQHIDNEGLMSFDRVVANPPFSLSWNPHAGFEEELGRFQYGIPRATVLILHLFRHMIASLNSEGKMVLHALGALFREGEKIFSKDIISDDLIESIIELPSSLFYNTNIATCILIINKRKHKERENKILFIGAEQEYEKSKFRNKLRESDINKIVENI